MLSRCQQKAAENNIMFMNRETEGTCGHSSHILSCESGEKRERENERMSRGEESVRVQRLWALFPSQLWEINGPEQNREADSGGGKLLRDGTDCVVNPSRAPFSFAVTSPTSDRWHSTRQRDPEAVCRNTSTLGQTCPGPRPSPHSSSHPINAVSIHSPILHLAPDFTPTSQQQSLSPSVFRFCSVIVAPVGVGERVRCVRAWCPGGGGAVWE